MGLDTSHGCWSGGYSAFMRWREKLAEVAGFPPLRSMDGFSDDGKGLSWAPYKSDALSVLLNHSDADGFIPAKECARLADRLEELLPLLQGEGGGHIGDWREKTQTFIDGLRLAARRRVPLTL